MIPMLKSMVRRLPAVDRLIALHGMVRNSGFVPPGHFYSPVVSIDEIRRDAQRVVRDAERAVELQKGAQHIELVPGSFQDLPPITHSLERFHEARFASNMPLCLQNPGGSIWIRKQ